MDLEEDGVHSEDIDIWCGEEDILWREDEASYILKEDSIVVIPNYNLTQ